MIYYFEEKKPKLCLRNASSTLHMEKNVHLVYVYILYPVFGISVLCVNVFEKFFRNGHNEIKFGSQ